MFLNLYDLLTLRSKFGQQFHVYSFMHLFRMTVCFFILLLLYGYFKPFHNITIKQNWNSLKKRNKPRATEKGKHLIFSEVVCFVIFLFSLWFVQNSNVRAVATAVVTSSSTTAMVRNLILIFFGFFCAVRFSSGLCVYFCYVIVAVVVLIALLNCLSWILIIAFWL